MLIWLGLKGRHDQEHQGLQLWENNCALSLATRPKYPPYRETGVAIPLSHCVSVVSQTIAATPPLLSVKVAYRGPKTGLTRGVSQKKLAPENYRVIGGVARNSIANSAIVGHKRCSERCSERVSQRLLGDLREVHFATHSPFQVALKVPRFSLRGPLREHPLRDPGLLPLFLLLLKTSPLILGWPRCSPISFKKSRSSGLDKD